MAKLYLRLNPTHLSDSVQVVVDSERILVSGDVSVAVDRSSSVCLVPGALVGAVRRHHLLLHCSVISVDGSWLSPARLFLYNAIQIMCALNLHLRSMKKLK